jgi:sec-independent protein translocase protein TatB
MPSFQDSALLIFLALLLFGPKKLPELARQLGKLMSEFRRASNEFRMQMEDELRIADQQEQQKKIAEMQAAAPVTPLMVESKENTIAAPSTEEPTEDHPHLPPAIAEPVLDSNLESTSQLVSEHTVSEQSPAPIAESIPEPLPIATSGELNLMPPSTGLPVSNSTLSPVLNSIPHIPEAEPDTPEIAVNEAAHHG